MRVSSDDRRLLTRVTVTVLLGAIFISSTFGGGIGYTLKTWKCGKSPVVIIQSLGFGASYGPAMIYVNPSEARAKAYQSPFLTLFEHRMVTCTVDEAKNEVIGDKENVTYIE